MNNLLLATIFFPLVGVALCAWLAPWGRTLVRQSALAVSLITLLLAGILVVQYARADNPSDFAGSQLAWLGAGSPINIEFSVGLDGLSIWMFGLAALLTVTSVLISWESIKERPAAFYAMLLLLETGMLGVFAARDIILFYIFFEFTLIPLFFLIGIWGSEERRHAAIKFFLFTFAGSVLTFLGLLTIVLWNRATSADHTFTFSIPKLTAALAAHPLPIDAAHGYLQLLVFLALFAGFAIKVPLFPLHTWLPLAHTQAPAAGSVLLAGVLLKIGCYGFLRFNLPMLPAAAAICLPWLMWLSVIGIVYGALLALAQKDMKRLIACSSVSHMGFVMLGIFAVNSVGLQGGVLQMINHGISTGALFALIGMLYDRYHTRQIADLGGLAKRLPRLTFFMLLFTFSSIGLPALNGFAGEFLILVGAFQRGWLQSPPGLGWQLVTIAVLAVSGVVLGAWYMLWLVQRVFFGPLKEPTEHHGGTEGHGEGNDRHAAVPDMNFREMLALAPLVVFAFWIGLQPATFLKPIQPAVENIAAAVEPPFQTHYAGGAPANGTVGRAASPSEFSADGLAVRPPAMPSTLAQQHPGHD
jgi:NADH-quinone oxidoreductase subunit M